MLRKTNLYLPYAAGLVLECLTKTFPHRKLGGKTVFKRSDYEDWCKKYHVEPYG